MYEHRRVSTGMCVLVCAYVAEIRPQYLGCVGSDQSLGSFCLSLLSVGINVYTTVSGFCLFVLPNF